MTNGIFVNKGNYFSDTKNVLTSRYLSNLKVFNYPLIQYEEDKNDPEGLIANIFLTPKQKYTFGFSTDFTHSNIQEFGISGIPALLVFKNGKLVERLAGLHQKSQLKTVLEKHI